MIEIKKLTKRYLNYVLSMCTDILDFNTSRFGRPVPLIKVLDWDRHNNVAGLNWLIGFKLPSS
jgi:hypothetical protein